MQKYFKGFTIIELVVVIAIIAILSGIVLISVSSYIQKAEVSSAQVQIKEISEALLSYYASNGCFPDPTHCSGGTCSCCARNGNCDPFADKQTGWNNTLTALANGGYIGKTASLQDDPWGNPYYYFVEWPDGHGTVCTGIYSFGSNKNDDGGGNCPYYNPTLDIGVTIDSHS